MGAYVVAYFDLQCIMITGDNPLMVVHVAHNVVIPGHTYILNLRENPVDEAGACSQSLPSIGIQPLADLVWKTVDETKIIPVISQFEPV